MTDITIPPEALRAARAASMNALGDGQDAVKAACLAMLEAWPDQFTGRSVVAVDCRTGGAPYVKLGIILPLTTEKPAPMSDINDKLAKIGVIRLATGDNAPLTLNEIETIGKSHSEITALRAEVERLKRLAIVQENLLRDKDALTARVKELEGALLEAAQELDAYYRAEYPGEHPYSIRKLKEAMESNPARAALSASQPAPIYDESGSVIASVQPASPWRPTHRHVKRGSTYEVVGRGMLQTGFPLEDNHLLVIYRAEDGSLWARPFQEFHDGRFETLPPAPQKEEEPKFAGCAHLRRPWP